MLRFSCFVAIVLSQSIVDLAARDRSVGDVLVDRHRGSPPSLRRCASSPAVVGMGGREEPPHLLLGAVAKEDPKQKDDDRTNVFASWNADNNDRAPSVQKDDCTAVVIPILSRLLNKKHNAFDEPCSLFILIILAQNFISTDYYINFMETVPLKERAATAKALNIDGLALVIEKKIRCLESSVGVACHEELERYKFNWLGSIRSSGRGHLGTAEAFMKILDGDMVDLNENFKTESSIFLKPSKEIDQVKVEEFKKALKEAIAIDKAKLKELSVEKERLKRLRSFVPADSMNYSALCCD